jgi:hypothetical protein
MEARSRSGQAKFRINGQVFFIAFRSIDADPTNGILLDTSHITLGCDWCTQRGKVTLVG